MKLKQYIGGLYLMSEYSKYLRWLYRRNLLKERGEEVNRGLIAKLNRKIRQYEGSHPEP